MASSVNGGILAAILLALMSPSLLAQPPSPRPAEESTPSPSAAPEQRYLSLQGPQTAEERFKAMLVTLNIGQPKLARQHLEQLLASDPDVATLARIRRQYGPSVFLRLARVRELQPLVDQLVQRVNTAAQQMARDPQRIQELIALLSTSPSERAWAIVELRGAGTAAVPPLLAVLQDTTRSEEHAFVRYALSNLEPVVLPALISALDAENMALKIQVLHVIGDLGDRRAVPFLWAPAASDREAKAIRAAAQEALRRLTGKPLSSPVAQLLHEAQRYELGHARLDSDAEGLVELWDWDPQNNTPVPYWVSPAEATQILAHRFARQALELAPENQEAQIVFLSIALARDANQVEDVHSWPRGPSTAFDLGLASGPELVAGVLRRATDRKQTMVAFAAAEILGHVGDVSLLYPSGRGPSVLVESLHYPDHRVQFAAAEAIMRLRPRDPFPGASEVVPVLARTVRSRGVKTALVADSYIERGFRLAGLVHQLGYATELATSGRETFHKARTSADYNMILLDLNILGWDLSETLANLRQDSRTAGIPVVLVGPLEWQPRLQHYEHEYPDIAYVVRPARGEDLRSQLEPEALARLESVRQERLQQARRAVQWLLRLARGEFQVGDPLQGQEALRDALHEPELAQDAALALGYLPSRSAQQALADVLGSPESSLPLRETAAQQLTHSIRKFGLLLEQAQVEPLHRAYVSSRDPRLHTALSAVLGCLQPSRQLTASRLKGYRAKSDDHRQADQESQPTGPQLEEATFNPEPRIVPIEPVR